MQPVRRWVSHADTDAAGVMHFSRFAVLFETAILENLERADRGIRRLHGEGLDLTVAELHVTYLAPARYADTLEVNPTVHTVANAYCRITGIVSSGDAAATALANAKVTLCVTSQETGRAVPLPAWLTRHLQEAMS